MLSDSVAIMLKRDDSEVCPLYVYEHDFLLEEIDGITYQIDSFHASRKEDTIQITATELTAV